jgi:hypothetical protein
VSRNASKSSRFRKEYFAKSLFPQQICRIDMQAGRTGPATASDRRKERAFGMTEGFWGLSCGQNLLEWHECILDSSGSS